MVTFRLASLVHYDRQQDGQPQGIYFDKIIEENFHIDLAQVMADFNKNFTGEAINYLPELTKAIDERLGELTIPQILFVVHTISGLINYNDGYAEGYNQSRTEIMTQFMEAKFGNGKQIKPTNSKQATA